MDSATSPSTASETSGPEPVKGKDIFWILIALAVLSSFHPLGTGCGLPSEWRRYARLLPFSALLDTIHLLKLIHSRCENWRHLREVRETSRALIEDILFSNIDDQNWRSPEVRKLLYWAVPWMLDIRPRTILNALVVLQYVKFYGYHGVPLSFAFGTAFFVAWIGLELAIFFAYGFSPQRPRQHNSGPLSSGILREPTSKKRFVGYVVLSLQLAALALLGISTFTHISISNVFRQLIHMFDPIRYMWRVANKANRSMYLDWIEPVNLDSDLVLQSTFVCAIVMLFIIPVGWLFYLMSLIDIYGILIGLVLGYLYLLICTILKTPLLFSSLIYKLLRIQKVREWVARVLTVVLLLGMSFGYLHPNVFGSTGTSKDAWTESMP